MPRLAEYDVNTVREAVVLSMAETSPVTIQELAMDFQMSSGHKCSDESMRGTVKRLTDARLLQWASSRDLHPSQLSERERKFALSKMGRDCLASLRALLNRREEASDADR